MKQLMMIGGEVIDIGDVSDLGDADLLNLMKSVFDEVKRRTGRCRICGRHHNLFQLCPTTPRVARDQPNEFEKRLESFLRRM